MQKYVPSKMRHFFWKIVKALRFDFTFDSCASYFTVVDVYWLDVSSGMIVPYRLKITTSQNLTYRLNMKYHIWDWLGIWPLLVKIWYRCMLSMLSASLLTPGGRPRRSRWGRSPRRSPCWGRTRGRRGGRTRTGRASGWRMLAGLGCTPLQLHIW